MELLTIIYLMFIFISLYSSFLILMILFRTKTELFNDKESDKLFPLTVLIPAYNEEKTIANTLKTLNNVNYPKELLEIIVINDGSTDNTLDIVKEFKNIKIIDKRNTGKADSLNQGLKIAKGEIVAVVDADSDPQADSFIKMVNYFKDQNTAAVTASVLVREPKSVLEKMQAIEYYLVAFSRKILDFVESVYVTPGPLSMYRRDVLLKYGGFDVNNLTEDIEVAWKLLNAGYRVRMCLSAKTYTAVPLTLKKWWRQRLRWDIGGLQTMNKYKSRTFRKSYNMFGLFVTPKFLISHVLSLGGFVIASYLIITHVFKISFYTKYSILGKIPILRISSINLNPSVFTIFLILLLFISLFYTIYGIKLITRSKILLTGKLNLLVYLLFYLALYPFVLLHSIYLILTGNVSRW